MEAIQSATKPLMSRERRYRTAKLSETDASAGTPAHPGRAGPHRWTPEEARNAARLSRESRATRRDRQGPSDAEIERGLRERAVSDPRAAEILLRWLQRPRVEERVGGVDLDSMSERELEQLYAGLLKLAALPEEHLHALLTSVLADEVDN
jgi:hypothetical protein